MSAFATDPGDLSPSDMYDRTPLRGTLVKAMPCPSCRNQDGSLNTEWMDEEGVCTFGCGRKVDNDTKFCGCCGDHSANEVECPTCDTRYAKWGNEWERAE